MLKVKVAWMGPSPLIYSLVGSRVPGGIIDGKDGHRLIPSLLNLAIGLLGLSGRQRMIR